MLPTLEQYSRELDSLLSGKILTMLLMETKTHSHPVGVVYAHDYNPYDRTLYWSIAVHPAYVNFGWGAEAGILFCDYLFTYFDLRKLSMDIYAFNPHSLRLVLRMGAHEEGRFLEEHYYQGAYHDVIRVAITRADWERSRERLVTVFARARARRRAGRADGDGPQAERRETSDARDSDVLVATEQAVGHNGHGPARQ
jgi:hypothetical protein